MEKKVPYSKKPPTTLNWNAQYVFVSSIKISFAVFCEQQTILSF